MNKKYLFVLIPIILLVAIYFIFLNSSSNSLENKVKTYGGETSDLVLSLQELPEGYKIAERSPRTLSDISNIALSWGWKEGYYIRYLKERGDLFDISRIELFISRYPIENISNGIEDGINEMEGYLSEALPDPNIGENSMSTRYTDEDFGLREYRIEFYSKDILITLINGGSSTDYEVLKELAQKVESKI